MINTSLTPSPCSEKIIASTNNLVGVLEFAAKSSDQKKSGITYVLHDGSEVFQSYRELLNKSLQISSVLNSKGISPGQHVIFQLTDIQNFVQLFWATIISKIIPIPLTFNGSVQPQSEAVLKLLNVINLIGETIIITEKPYYESIKLVVNDNPNVKVYYIEELLESAKDLAIDYKTIEYACPDDLAFIQFSSGSTGFPKGVMLTHANLVSHFKQIHNRLGEYGDSASASWMPLTHDMGLIGFHLSPLAYANNHLLMASDTFIKKPLLFLEKVTKHRLKIFGCPNFALSWILDKIENISKYDIDLSHVKLIFNGAEPICLNTIRKFNDVLGRYGLAPNTMYPVYGMAEACIAVTMPKPGEMFSGYCIDRSKTSMHSPVIDTLESGKFIEFADVGFNVDDLDIKILTDFGIELPENMIGSIAIKGPNVTKGYYKNPKANKELFVNGFLITGDLGFLRNGRLSIIGRKKDIIFLNGQNYYSHDLERIIGEINEIGNGKTAVCPILNECDKKDDIIVFVQFRKAISGFKDMALKIQKVLFQKTGLSVKYVIPVKCLPRTTSGKLQRFKLLAEFKSGVYKDIINEIKLYDVNNENDIKDEVFTKLSAIWCDVFKIEPIQANADFLSLGGDSLKMMEIIYRIKNEMGIDIGIEEFLNHPKLKMLSQITRNKIVEGNKIIYPKLFDDPGKIYEPFELTGVQMAYLMGRREEFELGGISTHAYYEIETSLDIKRFNQALNLVIERHGMLRAIFFNNGMQQIQEQVPNYEIFVEDIRMLDFKNQEMKILERRRQMSHHVFLVDKWPLFEFNALRLDDCKSVLFIGIDLLIADGASLLILVKELMDFYNNPGKIPEPLLFSFKDYVYGLGKLQQTELFQRDRNYWLIKLDTFPNSPSIPLKIDPSLIKMPHFKRISKQYNKQYWERIKVVARENRITPSALLCTIYSKVLSFWSNQRDLAINLTIFSRYPFHKDVSKIIGDFTSVLLIEASQKPDEDFWLNALAVQKTILEALEYRHFDGVQFIRELSKRNNLGSRSVMPYVFTSMLFGDQVENSSFDSLGKRCFGISQTSQVYLDYQALENNEELTITWDYVEELFDIVMIENMFKQYTAILESLVEGRIIGDPELPANDKSLLTKYNKTSEPFPQTTLTHLFIEAALKTPDNIAVVDSFGSINYRELNEKSTRIAIYLKNKGYGRGSYIGVLAKRQKETIANILGILKSGAAYIPIDPDYPDERKNYIIENSGCCDLIEPELYNKEHLEEQSTGNLFEITNEPNDVAYVIYTSGSTGRPKGVIINHGAVCNTIIDINQKFKVVSSDRIIGLSSMCFDLSVYDIFGALSVGAALIQINDIRDIQEIKQIALKYEVSVWNSVPAIMEMFLEKLESEERVINYWEASNQKEIEWQAFPPLRLIMMSGDWIPLNLPSRISKLYPFSNIISLGGATEASIWSIYYPILGIDERWKSIPYGMPLANQTFYVLNYQLESCPIGVQGELYIGGSGVASGYMNDAEKTQNAFIYHPRYGIIYKTGDYGVMHPDGYIEFLGRKDNQVKIRGHRIELGEIETILLKYPGIRNAAVIDHTGQNGKLDICGYVVMSTEIDWTALKMYILNYLPEYMVPTFFIQLDSIPLTPNGKVDRKALPPPDLKPNDKNSIEAPRTTIETEVMEIWKKVLGLNTIGINDNFFALGGDSIKAVRIYNLLQQNYKVDIKTLFQNQTIALLSNQLIYKDNCAEKSKYLYIKSMFEKKTTTNDFKFKEYINSLSDNQIKVKGKKHFGNILLLGSTGYLGCHILKDLLENTEANIILIVRGSDYNDALIRQIEIISFYFNQFDYTLFNDRVIIYNGDLCKSHLGLSKADYTHLANKTECIINSAALVKHLGNYSDFEKYNIEIVKHLLDFAEIGRKKEFHQISTSLLGLGQVEGQKSVVFTENDLNLNQNYDDFYIKSKFEAEKILDEARNKKNIIVNIYRVGNITFHSKTGHFQKNIEDNTFYQMVKLFFEQKIVPSASGEILDFCYVDYVSRAIILLFDKKGIENHNFHLINSKKISLKNLGDKLRSVNQDISILDVDSFIENIANIQMNSENTASMVDQLLVQIPYFIGDKDTNHVIPSEMTESILKELGFEWIEPNIENIKKMIEYSISLNFIKGGKND